MQASASERGFDFGPFPSGWSQVAWSKDLARGQVRSIDAFGQRLALFRGTDGVARMLDAYCPHLGADLGVGGTVAGNALRCPFHGWQFDGGGVCTQIPHARKIPPKARLGSWPMREVAGIVFAWHDAEGRPPWFEVPALSEQALHTASGATTVAFTIRTRWREIAENGVDRAHFHVLHGYPEPPALDATVDGVHFRMRSNVLWRRFGLEREVRLDIDWCGPLISVTRGAGDIPFIVLASTMPIDADTVIHRMTFMVPRSVPAPLRRLVRGIAAFAAGREFERDVPIWENKVCRPRPVLCDADGPIARFRSWARQFEARADRGPTSGGRRLPVIHRADDVNDVDRVDAVV